MIKNELVCDKKRLDRLYAFPDGRLHRPERKPYYTAEREWFSIKVFYGESVLGG